jgi:ketosteroid isomerase-like protein
MAVTDILDVVHRLVAATNDHDLDALVDCFSSDYVNETPAHPQRGFTGRDQVRRNWAAILAGVPDLRTSLLGSAVDGATAWTELQMDGRRRDGTPHAMAGVIIFTIHDDRIAAARFFMEPVEVTSGDVDAAVARASGQVAS